MAADQDNGQIGGHIPPSLAGFVSDTINEAITKIKEKTSCYGCEFHILWQLTSRDDLPPWLKQDDISPPKKKKKK